MTPSSGVSDVQRLFGNSVSSCYNKRSGSLTVYGWLSIIIIGLLVLNLIYKTGPRPSVKDDLNPKFDFPKPVEKVKISDVELDEKLDNLEEIDDLKKGDEISRTQNNGDSDKIEVEPEKLDLNEIEGMGKVNGEAEGDLDVKEEYSDLSRDAHIDLSALEGVDLRPRGLHNKGFQIKEPPVYPSMEELKKFPDFDPEMVKNPKGVGGVHGRFHHPQPKNFPVDVLTSPWSILKECQGELLTLVVLHSDPSRAGRRKAIRDTWGTQTHEKYPSLKNTKWRVVFVMGKHENRRFDVQEENRKYGDILQGDFPESPFEDTRKFLLGLYWITKHVKNSDCRPHFVLKSQDNIYHNMLTITKWMEYKMLEPTELYLGKILHRDMPIRDRENPLYIPEEDYPQNVYPDIIRGPVYLFTMQTYTGLISAVGKQVPIAMEDAFVGLLANLIHVTPRHNDHFQMLSRTSNVCHFLSAFFVHEVTASQQLDIFRKVKDESLRKECQDPQLVGHHSARRLET